MRDVLAEPIAEGVRKGSPPIASMSRNQTATVPAPMTVTSAGGTPGTPPSNTPLPPFSRSRKWAPACTANRPATSDSRRRRGASPLGWWRKPRPTRPSGSAPLAALLLCSAAVAGEDKKKEAIEDRVSETKHSVTIGGKSIRYTARTGTLVLREENGDPKAELFYIAYTKDGAEATQRPVTFAFNGGPGSSAVWLSQRSA